MQTMTVFDILESLESDGSRLAKEAILESNKDNVLLRRTFVAAGDPYTNYYVTKFDTPKPIIEGGGGQDMILEFFLDKVLKPLSTREVTGNAARALVEKAFKEMTPLEQKWCGRVLLRNLRVGASDKLVEKTWPGAVRKFAVALADVLESRLVDGTIQVAQPLSYPVIAEPKLDGLRCVAIKEAGAVTMWTRNGTLLETLPTIKAALEAHPMDDVVLDGEALGRDWNESASVVMSRKRAKDDSGMVYHVFDIVPLDAWKAQAETMGFEGRRLLLEETFAPQNTSPAIRLTDKRRIQCDTGLLKFYKECLALGYEGVMIKDPSAPYRWKRSSAILKLKPVSTHEGVIIGWHTGNERGKRAKEFGGFEVLLPNGVSTRVGTGLNDAVRAEVEAAGPDTYIGRIAECEAQEVTSDGKMRFPVFIRFRDPADVDPKVLEAGAKWKEVG